MRDFARNWWEGSHSTPQGCNVYSLEAWNRAHPARGAMLILKSADTVFPGKIDDATTTVAHFTPDGVRMNIESRPINIAPLTGCRSTSNHGL